MVPQSTHPSPSSAASPVARPRFHLAQALWMAGFWVLMTVAMTLQFWLRRREDLTEALLFSAVQWLPWALFTPVLFWLSEHYTLEKGRWQRTVWVHLGASLVTIVVLGLISYGLEPPPPMGPPTGERPGPPPERSRGTEAPFPGPPPGERRGPRRGPPSVTELILRRAMFQLPVCWAVVGVAHAFVFYRRAADREREAAELASRLAVARLQALRMQLNPHFLFNTLNSIVSLVHEDPRKADEMIGSLSELLRQTLDAADRQETTLREELSLLDRYLAIEHMDYIESAGNYAVLHVGKENHILRETLTNLETKLSPRLFLRVNRSALVNLTRVKELQPAARGEHVVILKDGKQLALTRGVREIQERLQYS